MTITVIICTLKNFKGLDEVLRTTNTQSLVPMEIIVVHGEDQVETKQICEKWKSNGLNIIYTQAPRSLVLQRNIGIDLSTGEIICFLDDDVILENEYFEFILKAYLANPNIGGVQGTITNNVKLRLPRYLLAKLFLMEDTFGDGKIKRSGSPSFLRPTQVSSYVEVFNGCLMTFKGELIKEIKFDTWLANDWLGDDFETSYCVSKRMKLLQIPDAKLIHIGNESFTRSPRLAYMIGKNYAYIRKKHGLNKGVGKLYCMWSDLGKIILFLSYYLRGEGIEYLKEWLKGRKDYKKTIIS